MSTFKFDTITNEFPKFNKDEVFIWVWNADKIPPHLGLSCGKQYFSLTFKGVDEYSTPAMIRKIKRSEIPGLFIQVETTIGQDTRKTFDLFERAKPGISTCLSPIKTVLGIDESVKQLAELLLIIKQDLRLKDVYGVFLPNDYQSLPVYNWNDIVSRIEVLNAER